MSITARFNEPQPGWGVEADFETAKKALNLYPIGKYE